MKKSKNRLSTGEFAKLNGINRRTLHYYDEIGLFPPAFKEENGYRRYAEGQTVELELILTLRKVGLSIEEIKRYRREASDRSLPELREEKKRRIDRAVRELTDIKEFLERKSEKLALSRRAEEGAVELLSLPEQPLLLSDPIRGVYDEEDFAVAGAFSRRLKRLFGLYDNFGSRIAAERAAEGDLSAYDRFFAYGREEDGVCDAVLPAGLYLRTFSIGDREKRKAAYEKLFTYAEASGLEPVGYSYEEGMNELSLPSSRDYVTMITVGCRRKTTHR